MRKGRTVAGGIYENILEAIGRTPLVRLRKITEGLKPRIYAKLEMFNPGGSVKDRIGIAMIRDAEARGALRPGGTIVEATSGNTGVGLAIAAGILGYRTIFTTTDKQSAEKINLLRAFGAEVMICPSEAPPDSPESFYAVARRLAGEIPGAFQPDQYQNPQNPEAHYRATGPEIWEQTEGRVTCFVGGLGTGGTVSGVGRYLKEKNPAVRIVGADPDGSIVRGYFYSGKIGEMHPYQVEGIGEDIIPGSMHFQYMDEVVTVTDRESFLLARRLAREEGILAGGSSGAALAAALKVAADLGENDLLVVLFPETGTRGLSKVHNDEWMRQFLADAEAREPREGT